MNFRKENKEAPDFKDLLMQEMQKTIQNPQKYLSKMLPVIQNEIRSRSTMQQNQTSSDKIPVSIKIHNPYDPTEDYTQEQYKSTTAEDTTFEIKPRKNLSKMFRVHKQARREMAMLSRGSRSSRTSSKEDLMVTSNSLETLHAKHLRPSGLILGSDDGHESKRAADLLAEITAREE